MELMALSEETQSSIGVPNQTAVPTTPLMTIYTDSEYAEYDIFLSDDSSLYGE